MTTTISMLPLRLAWVLFLLGVVGCIPSKHLSGTGEFGRETSIDLPPPISIELPSSGDSESGQESSDDDFGDEGITEIKSQKIRPIDSIKWQTNKTNSKTLPVGLFPNDKQLTVSAEKMPLVDFIHYVFRELLDTNYVIDDSVESNSSEEDLITLSIESSLDARALFRLTHDLLMRREIQIDYGNETFFIHRSSQLTDGAAVVIGIGRRLSDVPETVQRILQVVPLKFGVKITLERTLKQLSKAKITPDFTQSAVFIEGSREEVIRAIELINLLDTPAMRGRHIGLIEFDYLQPEQFAIQVTELLKNEGIDAAIGMPQNNNLVLVPIKQLAALAVFAAEEFLLERVQYWATLIDVAGDGPSKTYFTYRPNYSRAIDLESSVGDLLDLRRQDTSDERIGSTGVAPVASRAQDGGALDINIVVDEKSNLLLTYATGEQYRAILPLLRRLDVMPRQVMLNITIAEVTLQDEFKYGVEWALNQGEVNLTTQGAFGANTIGGFGVLIDGNDGPVNANFLTTNNLVKILSQPTLMVRDGVSASINVGSSISVVGQTTQDPINGERQISSSEYRKTGVDVSVTPTVNSSGIVLMTVNQKISNSVPGSAGAGGNPDIFERMIKTEVVAKSGQTIMLGGLISENMNNGGSGMPFMSKIPLLGGLFKAQGKVSDRTELVMLITPNVVEDLSDWEPLMDAFRSGLKQLKFQSTQAQ